MASGAKHGEGAKLLSEYRLDPNADVSHFGLQGQAKPWKKIALAIVLLVFGSVLLFTGVGMYVNGTQNGAHACAHAPLCTEPCMLACACNHACMHAWLQRCSMALYGLSVHAACNVMAQSHNADQGLPSHLLMPSALLNPAMCCPFLHAAIPMIVIGSLAFIPGSYFSHIAYMAYRGYRGYSLASIPDI